MATAAKQRAPRESKFAKAVGEAVRGIVARYDAAGSGKRMAGWNPPMSGPNRAITGVQKIRDRSRDAVRNDWSGESGVQKWATNLVGVGIVPRLKRITDATRKQELIDLWDDWVADADADCVLNFYAMQTLVVRAWLESGEVFARKRSRSPTFGMDIPLQVQLIEAEYVPLLDADMYPGMPAGNIIRSGIELDNRGQRVAYWMFRQHPGDYVLGNVDPSQLLRIAASEVLHIFMPSRPGQLRGVSSLAPILPKLRDLGDYQDAVLMRQKIANLFVAFLTRTSPPADGTTDPLTGKVMEGTFDNPLMPMAPGLIQELDEGQSVTFGNPPEAGTTYSDYIRTELMQLASASGIPYELYAGDLRQISDRTLRVIVNEFRRFAEQRQWQVVIPMFCQPVRDWFTVAAAAAGKIALAEVDGVRRVEWAPQGWAHIHPVQDPQGKQIEVDSGFRSRASVIAERGDDPDIVDLERQADDEREQKLKIGPYSAGAALNAPLPTPQKPIKPNGDGKPEPQQK